jgi:hypothetical protein
LFSLINQEREFHQSVVIQKIIEVIISIIHHILLVIKPIIKGINQIFILLFLGFLHN